VLDQELSEFLASLDEIALHRMSKHLMNIGRLRPTYHLVDRFLRTPFGHCRGCLKRVDPLPSIPLRYLDNRLQTRVGDLQTLTLRDAVKVLHNLQFRQRSEPEQSAS